MERRGGEVLTLLLLGRGRPLNSFGICLRRLGDDSQERQRRCVEIHARGQAVNQLPCVGPCIKNCVPIFEGGNGLRRGLESPALNFVIKIECAFNAEKESRRHGAIVPLGLKPRFNPQSTA